MTALEGIRVTDLTRVLSGPWCAMQLADLGAEVLKIENPAGGDETRGFLSPARDGHSTYFLTVNRNKKSIAVDLTRPEGAEIVRGLARVSDVLLENARTGALDRRGLGYEALAAENPGLVYCSISGYGRNGALADRPGYDPVAQGESGFMSLTGEPDGPPMRTGVSLVDIMAGMYAAQAVLAALVARGRTGRGQRLDVPLFDTAVAMTSHAATAWLEAGVDIGRSGNSNLVAMPAGLFEAADGPVMITVTTDRLFRRLVEAVFRRPDLADNPAYATNAARMANRAALTRAMNDILKADTREAWIARMRAAGIPGGPVRSLPEAFASEEMAQRGMVVTQAHSALGAVRAVRAPMSLSQTPVRAPAGAPLLGEHTEACLAALLGYAPARLARLRREGVILQA